MLYDETAYSRNKTCFLVLLSRTLGGSSACTLLMCVTCDSDNMSDSGLDTLVFVYGTLKIGEPNHHWLSEARGRSSFLGPGRTLDTWPLVVVTKYNIPMLLGKTW